MVLNFIRGFCMAMADSVPGVSGGTIAFLLGFYDKFIFSLDSLVSGTMEERKEGFIFLLKIGVGWIVGFLACVVLLASLFSEHIYMISSLFLGFIVFSIPLIVREENKVISGNHSHLIFTLLGAAIVFAITYFNPASGSGGIDITVSNLSVGLGIYIFLVAMVAISAMVLPGISGSTILLIFGLYVPIITGIKELLLFNFEYLPVIMIAGCGIIVGILSTVKLIKIALNKWRSQMIYFIIGLMIGSLYAIIQGPTTLDVPQPELSMATFNHLFFFLGIGFLFVLQLLKNITEK